ncbi:hypothetical protein [Nocardia yamanashiensis]|uniref:hypothetical protein n=1 Tax=Nocardia yamanashiensis TaxID=209247 RepID=UPI000829A78A|nr:hypothetical protein [Nocardia yamanashiensis]
MFVKFLAAAVIATGATAALTATAGADALTDGPYANFGDCAAAAQQAGYSDSGCHLGLGPQAGNWYFYKTGGTGSSSGS